MSTHGGNADPLRRALATLRGEGRDVRAFVPDWSGDAHAGHTETSLMLAVAAESVRCERAQAGDVRPLEQLIGALQTHGVRAVSPNGVLGDPTRSDADHGRELLEAAAAALAARLEAWP